MVVSGLKSFASCGCILRQLLSALHTIMVDIPGAKAHMRDKMIASNVSMSGQRSVHMM